MASGDYSDEMSDPSLSPDEGDSQFGKPFGGTRHPFAVKDKPILMNIRVRNVCYILKSDIFNLK